jgi:hypothetical protein
LKKKFPALAVIHLHFLRYSKAKKKKRTAPPPKKKKREDKNGEHMIGQNLWDLLVCDLHTATSISVHNT